MVREKWVITVTAQLTLEVTGRKKMIWHERAVLNLSRFSRNSDRLTGAHWKYIDNGLCSKFVTRIKDSNNMLWGYLNGVGGQCGQELGLFFSQYDPNVIKRLSDRVTISVTVRDDSGCWHSWYVEMRRLGCDHTDWSDVIGMLTKINSGSGGHQLF